MAHIQKQGSFWEQASSLWHISQTKTKFVNEKEIFFYY